MKIKKLPLMINKGVTLAATLIVTAVVGGGVVMLAKLVEFNAHQATYFRAMDETYKLAEFGLNSAVSELMVNGDIDDFNNAPEEVSELGGTYQNTLLESTYPYSGSYYLVTEANRSVGRNQTTTRLHSYLRVSNVSQYFLALNDDAVIGAGRDISLGKVYAKSIKFEILPGVKTKVKQIEYVESIDPIHAVNGTIDDPLDDTWLLSDGVTPAKDNVEITEPTNGTYGVPVRLKTYPLFPQILDSDLEWFESIAKGDVAGIGGHGGTSIDHDNHCIFTGDIFPPGYATKSEGGGEDCQNDAHHVYYCTNDMYVRGTVHGQVVFVAGGDIHITGDVVQWSGAPPGNTLTEYGNKANQAVFIANENIIIDEDAWVNFGGGPVHLVGDPTTWPNNPMTQTIEAVFLAPNPNSHLLVRQYPSIQHNNRLRLMFKGSMVLGLLHPDLNVAKVFRAYVGNETDATKQNHYAYDASLIDFPPPFLPAISEIYTSLEEVSSSSGLFN